MGRSADSKEKKHKDKSRKVATPNNSDVESVGKSSTSSTSSSDDDLDGKPVLDQLLAEPRKPKADPSLATAKEIGELPVMQLFNHHLKSFEGGGAKRSSGNRSR